MPIFGSTIGVALGSSGSYNLPTTSSLPGLVFIYTVPTSSNTFVTSSVASIEANIINADQTGSSGELIFRVPSPENGTSKGESIFKISATGSNNEPRVGIGFNDTEKPLKAFEIQTQIDSSQGTELNLRSKRSSVGAQVGDSAGKINFIIASGSYKDITTSGSLASIEGVVTSVSQRGVLGNLEVKLNADEDAEPEEFLVLSRGTSTLSSSLDMTGRVTSADLFQPTGLIISSGSGFQKFLSFPTGSDNMFDILFKGTPASPPNDTWRGGRILALCSDEGTLNFTVYSTTQIGQELSYDISASLNGGTAEFYMNKLPHTMVFQGYGTKL